MKFDLLSSIELTLCAAVAVTILGRGMRETPAARLRLIAAFAAWFVAVVILAATETLGPRHGLGVPGVGVAALAPILVLVGTTMRSPSWRRALRTMPLWRLIGVNAIRLLGLNFVILYGVGRLPAPFAPVAGWGDVLVGLTAVPVAWLAHAQKPGARFAILVWNTLGLMDLIAAVGLGVTSSPGPLQLIHAEPGTAIMSTLPWLLIPGYMVPLLASTHLGIFYRLAATATVSTPAGARESLASVAAD